MRGEFVPGGRLRRPEPRKPTDAGVQALAQPFVAELDPVDDDDGEVVRQAAVLREVEEGRDQLAPGQVPAAAEDDEDRRRQGRGAARGGQFVVHWVWKLPGSSRRS